MTRVEMMRIGYGRICFSGPKRHRVNPVTTCILPAINPIDAFHQLIISHDNIISHGRSFGLSPTFSMLLRSGFFISFGNLTVLLPWPKHKYIAQQPPRPTKSLTSTELQLRPSTAWSCCFLLQGGDSNRRTFGWTFRRVRRGQRFSGSGILCVGHVGCINET